MRNLAMMLRKGQGVAKDPKKAEEIYQRAAEAGLPTAQADLADMLLKGEAGPPDLAGALPLLEAAAAANHPVAQFELGELYETGAPPLLPKDLEEARQLYTAAASHGMKEAADRLRVVGPPCGTAAAAGRRRTAHRPHARRPAARALISRPIQAVSEGWQPSRRHRLGQFFLGERLAQLGRLDLGTAGNFGIAGGQDHRQAGPLRRGSPPSAVRRSSAAWTDR